MEIIYFVSILVLLAGLIIQIAVIRDLQERILDLEMQYNRRKYFKDLR